MELLRQVLIIRHGEKYGAPDPAPDAPAPENSAADITEDLADLQSGMHKEGVKHLSIRGSARAMALPSLFAESGCQSSCSLECPIQGIVTASYMEARESGILPRFLSPKKILATKESQASNRPCETVVPLAEYLKLPIDNSFSNNQFAELAKKVKDEYEEKIILICWHHGKIPRLAQALGIKSPPKWPGSVFDRIWQITWTSKGGGPLLEDLPQRLLFGDSLI